MIVSFLALAISWPTPQVEYIDRVFFRTEHSLQVTEVPNNERCRETIHHIDFERRRGLCHEVTSIHVHTYPTVTRRGPYLMFHYDGKFYRTRTLLRIERTYRARGMEGIK